MLFLILFYFILFSFQHFLLNTFLISYYFGLGRWWKYHKGESKSARRPEDLGTFPRQPFRLYRLISGCANNKDFQNRMPLFSKWFNYLGVGFSILSYPIVLFLLSHSHDGPHKLHRTSCAYTQIREYATYVLSVASWLIDNKIMLHYQFR